MDAFRAQIKTAPAGGFCQVQRQGETSPRQVAVGRHLSAAVVNDWVLVLESEGQLWAIAILGTGTTPAPPNPDPGGGPNLRPLAIPVAWTGTLRYTPYNGSAAKSFSADTTPGYFPTIGFGRMNGILGGNWRAEGFAVFGGLKGLSIASASLTFTRGLLTSTTANAGIRVALWSAPETAPADQQNSHPTGITRLADVALGDWPPPDTGLAFALPAGWIAQLVAGTANGIGLINNTMPPLAEMFGYSAVVSPLSVVYS